MQLYGRALLKPASLNMDNREVDVVFATETPVFRFGWEEDYNEVLVCEPSAVRTDRIDRGLPVMDCHNTGSVFNQIGRTTKVWFSENRELCATIKFSQRAEVAALLNDIAEGIVKDISVGYVVYSFEIIRDQENKLPTHRAIDWMPTEISFAPVQADIKSEIRNINSNNNPMEKTKREMVATIKYTVETDIINKGEIVEVDGVKYIALDDGESGEVIDIALLSSNEPDTTEDEDDATETAETTEDESNRRLDAILAATRAAGFPDSYGIDLFKSNKTIDACREEIISKLAERTHHVSGGHRVDVGLTAVEKKRDAMASALLHRIAPNRFKLDSTSREYRGMQVYELAKELMYAGGENTKGLSKSDIADRVFSRSHSTGDFPGLFSGVINRLLLEPYQSAPEYWDKIARRTSASDFREQAMYRLSKGQGMRETAEGAEIKYSSLVETDAALAVKSFADGIIYTRQAFVNDDLSAFELIPTAFASNWNTLRGDIVWGIITAHKNMSDGKALFSVEHNNLITGSDSALNEASLGKAKAAMTKQKDPAGRVIRVVPRFLVVPPELEVMARKLVTATTPASSEDVNVFANQFDVIVEPRLEDSTAWYLIADPMATDSLRYAYLEGNEGLRVHQSMDFDTDSMKYAVRGEFGAAAVDFRGLVKSNGK